MKIKRVNRYYCDYCKKSGCSAGAMRHHEQHCTMNPARKCGLCKTTTPAQLARAVASIPGPKQFEVPECEDSSAYYAVPDETAEKIICRLRQMLGYCPVCIYAALRQAGIAWIVRDKFDLKREIKAWWSEINTEEERAELMSYWG